MHDAAYSVVLCHLILDHAMRSGEAVGAGQPIGTVGPPGTVGNNGTAHVHLELHRGAQGSNPVPFGGPSGLSLAGADLPASGGANEHMSRVLGASGGPALSAPAAAAPANAPPAPASPPVPPRAVPAAPAPSVAPAEAAAPPAPRAPAQPPLARETAGVAQAADPPRQQAASVAPASPRPASPAVPARAAVVEGTGACLKVRDQPGLDGAVIDCVWEGTELQLGDGVERTNTLTWRQVRGLGWVAEEFLRRTRAVISGTGSCLNVRDAPSTLGAVLTCLPEGTSVALGESTQGEFGGWVRVDRGDQAGWVLDGFLS